MRLSPAQTDIIRQAVLETYGANAEVTLFGSRVDDNRRGGDIDLLIKAPMQDAAQALHQKISLLSKLEQQLGERKIDVLIETPNDTRPIIRIAHATGITL
jgi:predicted nucleotidyltransferase